MRFLKGLFVFGLFLCTNGAGGCFPSSSNGKVVTYDTSPEAIDVTITAEDKENPTDGKISVSISFRIPQGELEFHAGETVTCNGVMLADSETQGYEGRVTQVSAGDSYKFGYTRNGMPTTIDLTAVSRPQFTSPLSGAMVKRSSNLALSYVAGQGDFMLGDAADSTTGFESTAQGDNALYKNLDVTRLKAGPGSLGLTRVVTGTPLRTGFKSVQTTYSASSSVAVTWL